VIFGVGCYRDFPTTSAAASERDLWKPNGERVRTTGQDATSGYLIVCATKIDFF